MTDGDYLMLEVRNRSNRLPVYITVLHFPPENSVYCLYPEVEDNRFPAENKWVPLGKRFVFRAEATRDAKGQTVPAPAIETFKAIGTMEPSNYRNLLPAHPKMERGPGAVRGALQQHPSHPRGQKATPYDLGRIMGTALLGEDPDPNNPHTRSSTVPVVVTDWNTADVKVETRPKK
jgi:hypothetical protein